MANFKLQKSGYLYLIHWITSTRPLKITTGIKLEPSQWDETKQQPIDSNFKFNGVKVSDTVAKYKGAMATALQEIKVTRKELKPTFYSHLKGEVIRGGAMAVPKVYFLEFFADKIKEFETAKKSNYKSYKTTYNNCKEFFGRKRPTFDDLTEDFFDKFKAFLEQTKDYKKNTIAGQFKNIKAIIGKAYSVKLHTNSDYKEFKAGREVAVNVFLTLDELDKIYNLNFKNHPALERTKDSFIVACFTGLRFGDIGRIRSNLIKNGILRIQSTKTNEVSQIPIHRYVKAILEKYNGVMPTQLSNQKTNFNIKKVCLSAFLRSEFEKPYTKGGKRKAIPDRFKKYQMCSTHTARRSLCTNLILQGANPYVVMKISGHKTFEAFQKYIKLDELLAVDSLKALPMFSSKPEKISKPVKPPQKNISYLEHSALDVATGKIM
jgi:integrase